MYAGDEIYGDDVTSGVLDAQACESGWTSDRCTFRLHHAGPHSNETIWAAVAGIAAERQSWPRPTADMPDIEIIIDWSQDGEMEATDGCGGIEDDGFCEHQHPSWMLDLGMI